MTPLGLSGLRKHVWNLPLRRHSLPRLPKNSTFWPLGMTQVEHFSAGLLSIPIFICWLEFLNRGWILNWALRAGSIFRLPPRPPQCPGATPNGETRPLGKSDFRSQCPSRLRTPKPARPCFEGQEGILGLLSINMFVGDMSSLFSLLTFLDPATLPGTDLPLLPRFPEPVLRACNFFFKRSQNLPRFYHFFQSLEGCQKNYHRGFFCFLSLFLWTCHVSVYTSGLLSVWRNHLKIKKSRPHVHRSNWNLQSRPLDFEKRKKERYRWTCLLLGQPHHVGNKPLGTVNEISGPSAHPGRGPQPPLACDYILLIFGFREVLWDAECT